MGLVTIRVLFGLVARIASFRLQLRHWRKSAQYSVCCLFIVLFNSGGYIFVCFVVYQFYLIYVITFFSLFGYIVINKELCMSKRKSAP